MKPGDKYNWKQRHERLTYLGKQGLWHQFALVDRPNKVWCEVLDSELHLMEKTK